MGIEQEEHGFVISHIHSVTVVVSDQDKALDFYVNTLGWQVGMDNAMPGMRCCRSLVRGRRWPMAKAAAQATSPVSSSRMEAGTGVAATGVAMMPARYAPPPREPNPETRR